MLCREHSFRHAPHICNVWSVSFIDTASEYCLCSHHLYLPEKYCTFWDAQIIDCNGRLLGRWTPADFPGKFPFSVVLSLLTFLRTMDNYLVSLLSPSVTISLPFGNSVVKRSATLTFDLHSITVLHRYHSVLHVIIINVFCYYLVKFNALVGYFSSMFIFYIVWILVNAHFAFYRGSFLLPPLSHDMIYLHCISIIIEECQT